MNDGISCIVTCYNGIDCVHDAIMSSVIAAQHHQGDEVIVIDDASFDHSDDTIEELVDYLNKLYKKEIVRCICLDENVGVSETRNIGIRESKNNYVCFLDMDDIALLTRNFLYRRALHDHPEVDIFYGKCFMLQGDEFLIWEVNDYRFGALQKVCYLPAGSVLIKKDSFKEFFDPTLRLCGDYDFYLRAEIHGKKFFKLDVPLYTRRILPTSQGEANKKLMESEAEEVRRRYWAL